MKKSTSLTMLVAGLAISSCAPAGSPEDDGAGLPNGGEAAAARALPAAAGGAYGVPDDTALTIGADEAAQVAEEVADLYRPFAAARSATITIAPEWDSNASTIAALIRGVRGWFIIPRRPVLNRYLTRDVMRLTVCHELGHFFAGFPFSRAGNARPTPDITNLGTFLASEGQSDHFATKGCLWRVWAGDPDNAAYRGLVPPEGKARCDAVWGGDQDRRDMCYRSIFVAREWARWKNDAEPYSVDIGTPDPTVVSRTNYGYPTDQCRFDSMVAGALCDPEGGDPTQIPGLVPSPITGMYGHHSVASEDDSRGYSCHEGFGARPACWFRPDMPEFDCGNGVGWTRCEEDDAVLVSCTPPDGESRRQCSMGCVRFEDPEVDDEIYVCAEDFPPDEGD
ncbi:hypothetical protein WME91_34340 [Sorangium sp. So ce269]